MGRVFEKRKHKMFARYAKMAKAFTRIGKEIAIAVKMGGANLEGNPRLRMAIQNSKALNMPKDRVDAAIKRASSKEEKDFEEITYEGYGPGGVAIIVECATDNPTRTVANVRMHFNKFEGAMGKSGSVDYLFDRKAVFKIEKGNLNIEELELELIDFGAEEVFEEEGHIYIYTPFTQFGQMQKGLEDKGIAIVSSEFTRIPTTTADISPDQEKLNEKIIETLEDDDDVQNVYHNLK